MSGGSNAQKAVAKIMNISVSMVQRAAKIRDHGIPEWSDVIMAQQATIEAAYWLVMNTDHKTQREALRLAQGSKAELSRLVAQMKRDTGGRITPATHQCVCRTCGHAMTS